jgi:hypothetical protein
MSTRGILFGMAHQALTCTLRIAFPQYSEADVVHPVDQAPADAFRTALAVLASYTTTPAAGYAAIWEGWVGSTSAPQVPRVEIPNRAMLLSPALSTRSETLLLWLGTAPQRTSHKNRTSCSQRIEPGVWPARWTRRSSSPWGVPTKRPKLWLAPCPALFDKCATGIRLPYTATRPSANRSFASALTRRHGRPCTLR